MTLLHGYQAASDTWSPDFLAVLWGSRALEFVRTIDYGVRYDGGVPDPFVNTYERIDSLACMLSSQLQVDLEDSASALHNSWAFTRYRAGCLREFCALKMRVRLIQACPATSRFATAPTNTAAGSIGSSPSVVRTTAVFSPTT